MDQGMIRSLKAKYHEKMIQRFIRAVDMKKTFPKISILDAMQLLTSAWSEVSETTIESCFRKVGISGQSAEEAINDQDDLIKMTLRLKNLKKPLVSFVKDCPMKFQRS